MERSVSAATMVGIVLLGVVAVIGFSYGAFAITNGIAHEGHSQVATQSEVASNSWATTYDGRQVTGGQVLSILQEADSRVLSVFISTRSIERFLHTSSETPVLKHNGKYYINYGYIYNYEDSGYGYVNGDAEFTDNSNLFFVRDISSLKTDYLPKFEGKQMIKNGDFSSVFNSESPSYVDISSKFDSNLIYGVDGEITGVIFSQCTKTTYSGGDTGLVQGNIPNE